MNAEDVAEVVREARAAGATPDLSGVNLVGVNLSCANLAGADLTDASLADADLTDANLTDADLAGADMSVANLACANLTRANLFCADMSGADLTDANLTDANLTRADLARANLAGANMAGAKLSVANLTRVRGGILAIDGLHPYRCLHIPTPDGWVTQIGCWRGTIPELRALIARDEGWPEAVGDEITRRRPLLEAFCAMAEAHESAHPDLIADLADYWKDQTR